jgi:polyphosphate kinase
MLAEEQHLCFLNTILPQLTAEGIHLVRPEEMSGEQERFLEDFFHRTLYPIVTPLAIDPGHPFPYLANRSLCLVVSLRATGVSRLPYAELSIVHIPSQVVPRFIALPAKEGQHCIHAFGRCPAMAEKKNDGQRLSTELAQTWVEG